LLGIENTLREKFSKGARRRVEEAFPLQVALLDNLIFFE
jgi:hypothetical protein